jgi:hypothetical protein
MSNRRIMVVAATCGLVGVLAGAVGAQVLQIVQRRYLNTGMFSVAPGEMATFHLTLEDQAGAPPARVVLQLFDQEGAVVARQDATLLAGQSSMLQAPGPGLFRAHAEMVESVSQITQRRTAVGTVEVADTLTGVVRPVCSFDPIGVPGGRN